LQAGVCRFGGQTYPFDLAPDASRHAGLLGVVLGAEHVDALL